MKIPKDKVKKIKVRGGGCSMGNTDGDDVVIQGAGWRVRTGWFFRSTLIITPSPLRGGGDVVQIAKVKGNGNVTQIAGNAQRDLGRLVILLPYDFHPDFDISG